MRYSACNMTKTAIFGTTKALIPKAVTKGEDLIIISRKEYERLLNVVQDKVMLRQELDQALQEVAHGNIEGPFYTIEELRRSLEA